MGSDYFFGLNYQETLRWAFRVAWILWAIGSVAFIPLWVRAARRGHWLRSPLIVGPLITNCLALFETSLYVYAVTFEEDNLELVRFALLMVPGGWILAFIAAVLVVGQSTRWTFWRFWE